MSFWRVRLVNRWAVTGRLHRAVALLAGGAAVAQVLSILASPISTRLYTPGDYGALAVFNAFLGMATILATLRFELAIPLPESDERAFRVFQVCMVVVCVVSLTTALAVGFGGEALTSRLNLRPLQGYLWLLPIGVLGGGTYQALNYWALRKKQYGPIARTRLSQSVLGTATMLAVGAVRSGPLGLLLSAVLSQTSGVILLSRGLGNYVRGRGARASAVDLVATAGEYRQFPTFATATALLSSVAVLPPLVLAFLYGSEVTGWFTLAQKVTLLPLALIGTAVEQVIYGEAAQVSRLDPAGLPHLVLRASRRMLAPAAAVVLGGMLSPFAFPIVFGAKWAMAGYCTCFLSLFSAVQLATAPASSIVVVTQRLGVQLSYFSARAVLLVLALWIPALLRQSGLVAIASYALVMSAMSGGYFLVCMRLARGIDAGPR